jgi:hypothetical protein
VHRKSPAAQVGGSNESLHEWTSARIIDEFFLLLPGQYNSQLFHKTERKQATIQ